MEGHTRKWTVSVLYGLRRVLPHPVNTVGVCGVVQVGGGVNAVGSCVGKPDYSSEMREEGEGLYGELKLTYRYTEKETERERPF